VATSLIVIKRFDYRGVAEEWSNRYYLTGGDPVTPGEWATLFDALNAQEKTLYHSGVHIVRGYGYTSDAASATSVWTKDLTLLAAEVAGTATGGRPMSGDQVALVYWKTTRMNSRGKAIYLRKFFHAGYLNTSRQDELDPSHKVAYESFATLLATGAGVAGRHIRGPGVATDTIVTSGANLFVTTRTLKRRGKRPTSP